MNVDMYVEKIAGLLGGQAKSVAQRIQRHVLIGTYTSSGVMIDGIPDVIPHSNFQHQIQYDQTTKPTYSNGDRLVIVPAGGDGNHLIITGKLV